MKSTEELLQDRYKVIAPWPGGRYNVGDIVPVTEISEWSTAKYYYHDPYMSDVMMDKYPHLFKKLEWHEDREPGDIPEYVKMVDKGSEHYGQVHKIDDVYSYLLCYPKEFVPASQLEYDQQNSVK